MDEDKITKPSPAVTDSAVQSSGTKDAAHPTQSYTDSKGWDGKLRVEKKPVVLSNPEAISDPEYSDEENVLQGDFIDADEDLLDDYSADTDEIDCVHSRVSSIKDLRLERFHKVQRICLRQNAIRDVDGFSCVAATLEELDLYDNLISHIKGVEDLINLTSLDFSFNKIKHIKNVKHLKYLNDLYFVSNKISTIEGLDGLKNLRNLELAANRIREIQNLGTLTSLEELWLGKNKITEFKNLEPLVNLKILSIQSNRIRSLKGLESLANLEELYMSHNALTELSGLDHNKKLRVLEISNNRVSSLQGLEHLEHLEELWASYNQLGDFREVEQVLRDKKELTTVYFEGNPLQLRQPALYKNKVKLALPSIHQIDATYVRVS